MLSNILRNIEKEEKFSEKVNHGEFENVKASGEWDIIWKQQ